MPELQVKKIDAVCFLEAAKLTLEHLAAHRLGLSQSSVDSPKELTRLYGNVRRVRDYMQRCVSAYQDVVSLDLTDDDAGLLVACCRRSVEAIENRLAGTALSPDENQWLVKNRAVLSDWAVAMAARPLVDLPLRSLMKVLPEAVRALSARLDKKVHGDVNNRKQFRAIQPSSYGQSQGTTFGETLTSDGGVPQEGVLSESVLVKTTPPGAVPPQQGKQQPALPPLLAPNRLKDPRLRSLVVIDLSSLARCVRDSDYRLSTVLLASIMESAILDHAIPRRAEFGLTGTPDTWKLHEVVLQSMGESVEPKDRSLAFHLFASRNLLHPARQMVTPAVITVASFESLHEFVSRALHELGFGAPARSLPSGFISKGDMLL
jgi:hypothetical protein